MRRRILLISAALAALAAAPARGEIYRYVDDSGTVVYTDKPRPGAEKVELPGISVYRGGVPRAGSPPAGDGKKKPAKEAGPAYEAVRIVSPAHDQAFWSAAGEVVVQVETQPPLRVKAGHRLRLYVDGRPLEGLLETTAVRLRNIARGTHTLRAEVVDGTGRVLAESEPITFHLHRPSVLRPKPP